MAALGHPSDVEVEASVARGDARAGRSSAADDQPLKQ